MEEDTLMQNYVIVLAVDTELKSIVIINKNRGPSSVKGRVNFPGGHVEHGENPTYSAVRELEEETGLLVKEEELKPMTVFTDNSSFHIDIYAVNMPYTQLCTAISKTDEVVEIVNIEQMKLDIASNPDGYARGLDHLLDILPYSFSISTVHP